MRNSTRSLPLGQTVLGTNKQFVVHLYACFKEDSIASAKISRYFDYGVDSILRTFAHILQGSVH